MDVIGIAIGITYGVLFAVAIVLLIYFIIRRVKIRKKEDFDKRDN